MVVGKVTHHRTPVIAVGSIAVVDFRCRGISVVVARVVLVAGEDLLSVNVRIEVSHVVGIAMT